MDLFEKLAIASAAFGVGILAAFSTAKGESLSGYDVLGLAKYCNRYLEAPPLPAVSTLMNTFGDPIPCLDKALSRGFLKVVQVDLIDATCWRNKVCPKGVPKPSDLGVIKKRAQEVSKLATKYPSVEFWVSPALEHDVKDAGTVDKMMKAAGEGCPQCKVINSPFSGAKNKPLELHGTKVRAFNVSGDGASMFDGDNLINDGNGFEHWRSGEAVTYSWWNELNLRCTGEKKFTPPLQRTEKPSRDQFRQAYLTMRPEDAIPSAPNRCKQVVKIDAKKGEIFKPNAESYCNGVAGDNRGNKPMLIIRKGGKKGDKMSILNSAGKRVGCFAYWGSYEKPGLHRWYIGNCSGQAPAALYDAQGGEWGYTELGGGKCLLTNSIRRLGVYR